jgi:hypothetical protein
MELPSISFLVGYITARSIYPGDIVQRPPSTDLCTDEDMAGL